MTSAQWVALAAAVAVPGSLVVVVGLVRGYNVLIWRERKPDRPTGEGRPGQEGL